MQSTSKHQDHQPRPPRCKGAQARTLHTAALTNDLGPGRGAERRRGEGAGARVAVHVSIQPGYDPSYPWKQIGTATAAAAPPGLDYYLAPAEKGGEPPGIWGGRGLAAVLPVPSAVTGPFQAVRAFSFLIVICIMLGCDAVH